MKTKGIVLGAFSSIFSFNIMAHGGLSFPESRQWLCSGGATPNNGVQWNGTNGASICSIDIQGEGINKVITDWSGVAQGAANGGSNQQEYKKDPRTKHIQVMGGLDAKVCSGGNGAFSALDNPIWTQDQGDKVYPTTIRSGSNQFAYTVTASHNTMGNGYIDFYITKDNWDESKELTWSDFETAPFCHYSPKTGNTPLQSYGMGGVENFECNVPSAKSGQQVIFSVWQRNDSQEAFYSCSDVIINGEVPGPDPVPEKPWIALPSQSGKYKLPSLNVTVNDKITFEVCPVSGACDIAILSPSNNAEINDWQRSLASIINVGIFHQDIQIGILSDDGKEVETDLASSGYGVYQKINSGRDYTWRIEHKQAEPDPIPNPSLWTKLIGSEGTAIFRSDKEFTFKEQDTINFRLWRSNLELSGYRGGLNEVEEVSIEMTSANIGTWKDDLISKINSELHDRGLIIGVKQEDDTIKHLINVDNKVYIDADVGESSHYKYTWLLENKEPDPIPDPEKGYWQQDMNYIVGDLVLGDNSNTYKCIGGTGGLWVAQCSAVNPTHPSASFYWEKQ